MCPERTRDFGGAGRIRTADEDFADLVELGIVLARAGLWSVQLPRLTSCLGRIGLRLDYTGRAVRPAFRCWSPRDRREPRSPLRVDRLCTSPQAAPWVPQPERDPAVVRPRQHGAPAELRAVVRPQHLRHTT